jgi:hypothetical protein
VELLTPRQTPNLEDQGIHFVWVITLDLSGMGGPAGSIRYRQHSSQDHVNARYNSVALVRERTIPTERPPPVGEECEVYATHINLPVNFAILVYSLISVAMNHGRSREVQTRLQYEHGTVPPLLLTSLLTLILLMWRIG